MCQGLELWWQAAPSLQALQENVLCEPKMILLSLFKRWGVHHRSSGRSRVLWTSGQCGVRAGHKKWSMPWKNFKPFNLFPFLMRQKKENLGIFFFFSLQNVMENIFPPGCCLQCWEYLQSWDLDVDLPPFLGVRPSGCGWVWIGFLCLSFGYPSHSSQI